MSFEDKVLQCADCGQDFTFTAGEQDFFASKGYTNEPKRCPSCRQSRRSDRYGSSGGGGYGARRQMFPAVCAECGKETEVPFEPREGRPVYCSECYAKSRLSR
ncbi:MAG: zinc-ribbon domain containing protein [Dehalococcoidales bacterium]|nr:zinc-ribbon domain containing protein [Dehalococcoidales bacterium]MDZ4230282.1 zinc-ribbon domain containing protein [Dehalococcoidales bacterium]